MSDEQTQVQEAAPEKLIVPVGWAYRAPTCAFLLEDGTWCWHGFGYATLEEACAAAQAAGY